MAPMGDGTGPMGQGPRYGKGMGPCGGGRGQGRGQGQAPGQNQGGASGGGRGMGRGMGMRGQGYGMPNTMDQNTTAPDAKQN